MRTDALRIEAKHLPMSVDDLAALRSRVIDAGHRADVANGLVGWLVSKAVGERDVTGANTRAKYRRILEELDFDPDEDPDGDRAELDELAEARRQNEDYGRSRSAGRPGGGEPVPVGLAA